MILYINAILYLALPAAINAIMPSGNAAMFMPIDSGMRTSQSPNIFPTLSYLAFSGPLMLWCLIC